MNIYKLEKELARAKKNLIKEALDSCTAIVEDTFVGGDTNGLKADFPEEVTYNDINIAFQALKLNIEHISLKTPSIEVVIMMEAYQSELGYYLIMYDDELNRIDEYFVIE